MRIFKFQKTASTGSSITPIRFNILLFLYSMKELVEMLFLDGSSANVVEKMKSCYRFHVAEVNNKFGGGKDFQYNLWCFNPGLSIKSLVDCNIRSLILTSEYSL